MKKIIIMLLCFAMILPSFPVSGIDEADYILKPVFEMKFDGYNATETNPGCPPGMLGNLNSGYIYADDAQNPTAVIFKAVADKSQPWIGFDNKEITNPQIIAETTFTPNSEKVMAEFILMGSGNTRFVYPFTLSPNGTFSFYKVTNSTNAAKYEQYTQGLQYQVKAVINFSARKFSLYINGDEIAKDATIDDAGFTGVKSMRWAVYEGNVGKIPGESNISVSKLVLYTLEDKPKITRTDIKGNSIEVSFNKEMKEESFNNAVSLAVGNENIPMGFTGSYSDKKYILSSIDKILENTTYTVNFKDTLSCIDSGKLSESSVSIKTPVTTVGTKEVIFKSSGSVIQKASDIGGALTAEAAVLNNTAQPQTVTGVLCLYSDDILLDYDTVTAADITETEKPLPQLSVEGNGNGAAFYLFDGSGKPLGEPVVLKESRIYVPQPGTATQNMGFADRIYDVKTNKVKVFGKTNPYERVMVRTKLKPSAQAVSEVSLASTSEIPDYAATITTMSFADGYYETQFGIDEARFLSDDYIIEVISETNSKTLEFKFSNKSQGITALSLVNSATTVPLMKSAILDNNNSKVFALELTDYNLLTSKDKAFEFVLNERPQAGYTESSDVNVSFNKAVALQKLNEKKDVEKTISDYATYFDRSSTAMTQLSNKDFAFEIMQKNVYTKYEQFGKRFDETLMFCELNSAPKPADLKKLVLETYSDDIKPFTNTEISQKYKAINEKNLVFDKFLHGKFYSTVAVLSAFEAGVLAVYRKENPPRPSGDGGGGGLGGGGGGGKKITITTQPQKEEKEPFRYLDLDHSAKETHAIYSLTSKGVICGDGNGKFRPQDGIRRDEFVKMLIMTFELSKEGSKSEFTDVPKTDWSYKYISDAYELGLVLGKGNGFFDKGSLLTREEMFTLLYRTLNHCGILLKSDEPQLYDDYLDISLYAIPAINALSKQGLISGNSEGEICPQKTASRAEAAYVLWQCLNYTGGVK